ncbi:MAG TPA: DUF6785 family protein [Armatimonadota bacterium]|jgi:hypothetical protein
MSEVVETPSRPAEAGSTQAEAPPKGRWVTARSVFLALLLIPIAAYWCSDQGVDTILSLMVPPIGILLVVVILNAAVRKMKPKWCLTEGELITIYGMLSVACAVASEWVGNINPVIYSYGLFATEGNRFKELMLPFLPDCLYIKDYALLRDFEAGGHPFSYFVSHLGIWIGPVLWWTALVGALAGAMLCINVLMRDQWANREKLAFPIIQLPLALCEDGGKSRFFRNPVMWIGFLTVFSIDTLNGLHFLYPVVPQINVRFIGDASQAFSSPPWNSIGWTPIAIFPFIFGLCLFLPSDLLFSCIFFFVLRKLQQVIAASYGYPQGVFGGGWLVPAAPYFSEQSWGAFLGLFVMALWIARGYLKEVWHKLRYGGGDAPTLRLSAGLLVLCLLALGGFGHLMGLSPLFTAVYLGLFLAFSVALTRMRAELGPPTHEMAFMGPNQLVVDFAGTQNLGNGTIANLAANFHFANRIHRTDPMPAQLEALKMAERPGLKPVGMLLALGAAIIMGSLAGHLVRIYLVYRWGSPSNGVGNESASVVSGLVNDPRKPNPVAMLFVGIGAVTVFALNFLRFRIPSFPFNPVGYALAMNFGVDYYWMGMLLAFVVKSLVQRYSGLKGYTKLYALALGIILGEFASETIWATVAMVGRYATYSISINGRLGWDQ